MPLKKTVSQSQTIMKFNADTGKPTTNQEANVTGDSTERCSFQMLKAYKLK